MLSAFNGLSFLFHGGGGEGGHLGADRGHLLLQGLGLHAEADEQIWQRLWSEEEKLNFFSTPLFLVRAVKTGKLETTPPSTKTLSSMTQGSKTGGIDIEARIAAAILPLFKTTFSPV